MPACRQSQPEPVQVGPDHLARCLRIDHIAGVTDPATDLA
jgi:hypothetical protein